MMSHRRKRNLIHSMQEFKNIFLISHDKKFQKCCRNKFCTKFKNIAQKLFVVLNDTL